MSQHRDHPTRAPSGWKGLLAIFTAAALGAGVPHTADGLLERHRGGQRIEAMAFELIALRGRLEAKQAEVEEQIAITEHLLGWILDVEIGGSAELLSGFANISTRPGPVRAPWLDGVVAAGTPELRRDLALWGKLASLRSELTMVEETGLHAHRAYVRELDRRLEGAVWASIFEIGPELAPVRYGDALRGLKESDFPGVLRHQLRGMRSRAEALEDLERRVGGVIATLEVAP